MGVKSSPLANVRSPSASHSAVEIYTISPSISNVAYGRAGLTSGRGRSGTGTMYPQRSDLMAFPHGIDGSGATPGAGEMACTSQPSPCRMRHAEYGGRSRQRPPASARHGHSVRYATNATTTAPCRTCGVSRPSAVLVHKDPDVRRTPLDRQRPPLTGDQIPPSEKRLERHTVKRSIIASEGAVGSAARSSASRVRQSRRRP